jgi:hypothetical protein
MNEKLFLTGCDKNTEWQLEWFLNNLRKHTDCKVAVGDFGMTKEARTWCKEHFDYVLDVNAEGWFAKVEMMWMMKPTFGNGKYCWLDTDCQVVANPEGIFGYTEYDKLTMVVDHPWTENGSPWTPQGNCGPWYNSGVVAFQIDNLNLPIVLQNWRQEIKAQKHRGDQEALYWLLNLSAMNRVIHIAEAPHRYNVLRLDTLQERVPNKPVVMHWTGHKGKDEIKRQMK